MPQTNDEFNPQTNSRLSRIANRAHEIYEARGGEDGRAIDDWLAAEREIDEDGQLYGDDVEQ